VSDGFGLSQSETALAVGPTGQLGIVFIGPLAIGYTASTDDGDTWSTPVQIAAPAGRSGVDPAITFGADGTAYISFLGLRYDNSGQISDRHIYVTQVPPNGMPGLPLEVSNPAITDAFDKPWIIPLKPKGFLVTSTSDNGSIIYLSRDDGSGTWTLSSLTPDSTLRAVAYPCTGGDGAHVFIVNITPTTVELTTSADAGVTWSKPILASAPGEAVAFDPPSCVTDGKQVWISYGVLGTPGGFLTSDISAHVVVARSDDQGKSISARGHVYDKGSYLHPALARSDSGALAVMTYTDAMNGTLDLRWGSDLTTMTSSATLLGMLTFTADRTGLDWLGDYTSLSFENGVIRAAFADNGPKPGGGSHASIRYLRARLK
jgi:hypothetical protein